MNKGRTYQSLLDDAFELRKTIGALERKGRGRSGADNAHLKLARAQLRFTKKLLSEHPERPVQRSLWEASPYPHYKD